MIRCGYMLTTKSDVGGIANMSNKIVKTNSKSICSRVIASIITILVLLSVAQPVSAQKVGFSDVTPNYTHYQNIMDAQDLNFISGYPDGSFKPLRELSRSNVVKILGKYALEMNGLTLETYDVSGVKPFADADESFPDKELVKYSLIVRKEGIFKGDPNNHLKPNNLMSRQQIAQVMVNTFHLKDLPGETSKVKDNDKAMDDAYRNAINLLSKNGVTNVEYFRPTEYTNRGQLASFLMRAYNVSQKNIADIQDLGDIYTKRGERVSLPETIGVKYKNGEPGEEKINWRTDNLNVDKIGTYIITGKIHESTYPVQVKVIVERLNKVAPTFDYEGETSYTIKYGAEFSLPVVKATDEMGENVTVNKVINLNDKVVSEVDTKKPGNYSITYDAKDLDGNNAHPLHIFIIVEEEDLIGPKIEAAEQAIEKIPSLDQLTLTHQSIVAEARILVDEVLEVDNSANIKGIEQLIVAESTIEKLVAAKELSDMIEEVEQKIAQLPATELLTNNDRSLVESARNLVNRIQQLDSTAVIEGLSVLAAAEKKMEELYVPTLIFPSQSTSIINNRYQSISFSMMNTSKVSLTIEKIELVENDRVRNTYTKELLNNNDIQTFLLPGEMTSLSISFNFNKPSQLNENYFKVYASDGKKVFEYISILK